MNSSPNAEGQKGQKYQISEKCHNISKKNTENYIPEINEGHRQNPDEKMNSSPNAEGQKPEPKKNVDFFIYDIDSQNTETVLVFNSSGRTIVVECTLSHLKIKISQSLN